MKKDYKGSIEKAPIPSRSPREKLISTILWVVAGAMLVFMVTLVIINPPEFPGYIQLPHLHQQLRAVEPLKTPTESSAVSWKHLITR